MKNSLSRIEDIEKDIEEIGYFEQEVDPVIEKLVNDFIEKATPISFPHYVDTDENDGQLLRVKLTIYFRHQILALIKGIKAELPKNIGTGLGSDYNAGCADGYTVAMNQVEAILDKMLKEGEV